VFWALLRRVCPETDRAQAFLSGVGWLGRRWRSLPPVERALLTRAEGFEETDSSMERGEPQTGPEQANGDW